MTGSIARDVLGVMKLAAIAGITGEAAAVAKPAADALPIKPTGCTEDERRNMLQELQQAVLKMAPRRVDSLDQAIQPGGPLAGWRLSQPQLLLYAPSSTTSPADWLDFDRPDGPYKLVGWAYIVPYQPGANAPKRRCIAEQEWLVHEAGWRMMDGGMVLTPGATREPPRPPNLRIYFWHPRVWDLHFWTTSADTSVIADENPNAPKGGVRLPSAAFFHQVDGHRYPLARPAG